MQDFEDILEMFEDYTRDPRPVVQEPRNMYNQGQLVRNTVDGSRPGYNGPVQPSSQKKTTYYTKLINDLPEGYLEDYKRLFMTANEDGTFSARPGDAFTKGEVAEMKKKYGEILKTHYPSRQKNKQGLKFLDPRIIDINSAILENQDKLDFNKVSKLSEADAIRKADSEILGKWQPKAPKGMNTHHFMPLAGIEGDSLNLSSTKNTAYIPEKLNERMSLYDKKLKQNQKQQIELLKNKPKETSGPAYEAWKKKIEDINVRSRGLVTNSRKKVPGSAGYLGYSEITVKPDGTYSVKVRGIDYNKTIAGLKGEEILYKNISNADKIKVQKGGLLKILQDAKVPCIKGEGGQCNSIEDYKKGFNEIVNKAASGDKAAVSRANTFLKRMRKLKPALKATGYGILGEIGFVVPFALNDYASGESWNRILGNAMDFGLGPIIGQSEQEEINSYLPEGSNAVAFQDVQKTGEDINTLETGEKIPGYSNLYNELKNRPMTGLDPFSLGKFDEQSKQNRINEMTLDFDKNLQRFLTNGEWDQAKANQAAKEMEDAKAQKEQNKQKIIEERKTSGIIAEDDYLQNMKKYYD
jgi:hypothetical protein